MTFGIGEAQMYLGRVGDQFDCGLASVKQALASGVAAAQPEHTCVLFECPVASVGLMISLSVIWYR